MWQKSPQSSPADIWSFFLGYAGWRPNGSRRNIPSHSHSMAQFFWDPDVASTFQALSERLCLKWNEWDILKFDSPSPYENGQLGSIHKYPAFDAAKTIRMDRLICWSPTTPWETAQSLPTPSAATLGSTAKHSSLVSIRSRAHIPMETPWWVEILQMTKKTWITMDEPHKLHEIPISHVQKIPASMIWTPPRRRSKAPRWPGTH